MSAQAFSPRLFRCRRLASGLGIHVFAHGRQEAERVLGGAPLARRALTTTVCRGSAETDEDVPARPDGNALPASDRDKSRFRRQTRPSIVQTPRRHNPLRRPPPGAANARELFAPLGPTYDRYARVLSFGQDRRWRRFLVSRVRAGPGDTVLDVATGTGAVATELVRTKRCTVVGLDQSPEMLEEARRRVPPGVRLVEGTAERLPFADRSFDALTFTYLLRYVDDPGATLRELARVVRPGGTVAGLDFAIPENRAARAAWRAYVRVGLPLAGRMIGSGWAEVGDFLGPSIDEFWQRHPGTRLLELWRDAGVDDVQQRRLSLGGGVVVWGRRR